MLSEEIHNFFRPWFYTTADLSLKNSKSSNATGIWAFDDILLNAELLKKGSETIHTFSTKLSSLITLFSAYIESIKKYSSLSDFEEMGSDEKEVYNELMAEISKQSAALTELSSLVQAPEPHKQVELIYATVESMTDSILLLAELTKNSYSLWRKRNIISQCKICLFVNDNDSIYCISCGKVFLLEQDELMTEMILNLSLYQEHIFKAESLLTTNKISDFFFKFLAFLNGEMPVELIIREFDIIYIILRKTKLKVEKTLYTANQYYVDDPRLVCGWNFIEGVDKIIAIFADLRNSIILADNNDYMKIWSEVIFAVRKINDGIDFYSLMNEWEQIAD